MYCSPHPDLTIAMAIATYTFPADLDHCLRGSTSVFFITEVM